MKIASSQCIFALGTIAAVGFSCALGAQAQESGRGRKYKPPPPVSHLVVTVTRAKNNQPIEDAAVIFHTIHQGKDQGNMELKTDEHGKATLNLIPIGDQVQLQVFKMGFQTYGENFVNTDSSRDINVHLKPPKGQYSIYQSAPVGNPNQQDTTPKPTEGASAPHPH